MKEKEKKEYDRETYDIRGGDRIRGWFSHALLREFLLESGKSGIWKTVDAIFFSRCNKDKRN